MKLFFEVLTLNLFLTAHLPKGLFIVCSSDSPDKPQDCMKLPLPAVPLTFPQLYCQRVIIFVDGSCSKPSDCTYLCGYAINKLFVGLTLFNQHRLLN